MEQQWNINDVKKEGPELLIRWAFREYAFTAVSGILDMLDENDDGRAGNGLLFRAAENYINMVIKFCNNFKIFASHPQVILKLPRNLESTQTMPWVYTMIILGLSILHWITILKINCPVSQVQLPLLKFSTHFEE